MTCWFCSGTGKLPLQDGEIPRCYHCDGQGWVESGGREMMKQEICHHGTIDPVTGKTVYLCNLLAGHPGPHQNPHDADTKLDLREIPKIELVEELKRREVEEEAQRKAKEEVRYNRASLVGLTLWEMEFVRGELEGAIRHYGGDEDGPRMKLLDKKLAEAIKQAQGNG